MKDHEKEIVTEFIKFYGKEEGLDGAEDVDKLFKVMHQFLKRNDKTYRVKDIEEILKELGNKGYEIDGNGDFERNYFLVTTKMIAYAGKKLGKPELTGVKGVEACSYFGENWCDEDGKWWFPLWMLEEVEDEN